MKLSSKTISAVGEILKGDPSAGESKRLSPYRTLWQLTEFFRDYGERDIHPNSGAPSRIAYVKEKLNKFNGGEQIEQIICSGLDFWGDPETHPEQAAAFLNAFSWVRGFFAQMPSAFACISSDASGSNTTTTIFIFIS
jgi:hypothetical protein